MNNMNRRWVAAVSLALVILAGCAAPVSQTTVAPSTTSEHSRYLTIEGQNAEPITVSVRISEYESESGPVVADSFTASPGMERDYSADLDANTTYLVEVGTAIDTQKQVLRTYQSVTFVIKNDGTIERQLEVE